MRRFSAIFIALSLACAASAGGGDDASSSAAPSSGIQARRAVIDHIEPKRDSMGGVPPRFVWTSAEGADRYVIQLWNDIDVLLWRQYVTGTSVPWPKPLEVEEGTYFWTVGGLRGDQLIADSGRAAFVIVHTR